MTNNSMHNPCSVTYTKITFSVRSKTRGYAKVFISEYLTKNQSSIDYRSDCQFCAN